MTPYDLEEPTYKDILSLKKAFNAFSANMSKFWFFKLTLNFNELEKVTYNVFEQIAPFIEQHYKMIDKFLS